LQHVPGLKVVEASDIPPQCIAIGDQVIAFIDDLDAWESVAPSRRGELVAWVSEFRPRIIFKYQFRRGVEYLPGTVSAGFVCATHDIARPADLATRPRPIDVSARMRTTEYAYPDHTLPWMRERQTVVEQAAQLQRDGFVARHGKTAVDVYLRELFDTKIGFNWRGFGMLTYRIIEYLRAGVAMITQPLGPEWPLREDIILEDGVTCLFCDDPGRFAAEARLLLRDAEKMNRIRRNALDLWNDKLCLRAIGQWYWEKLRPAPLP
jgi:hypothetical protein